MSDPSFQEPAASTSASNEPDSTSPRNAKSTRGDAASSPPTGPTPPATRTFAKSRRAGENDPSPESWKASETAPTLDAAGHGPRTATLVIYDEQNDRSVADVGTLSSGLAHRNRGFLISSAADSPAKTSPTPDDEPDSTAPAPASSSNTPESQLSFDQDGSWSKTSQGYSPLPTAATLPWFSQRWPTSGMASPGGYWTLATSESPNDAAECSLSAILEATPNPRYALSARAATGILRRARARGRELPAELEAALRALS